MSPADSGSPRAARRQEPLHGHSSVQEPAKQGLAPRPALTLPSGPRVLPASVPPSRGSVPQAQEPSARQVLRDSVPRRLDSVPQAQELSDPPRAVRAW